MRTKNLLVFALVATVGSLVSQAQASLLAPGGTSLASSEGDPTGGSIVGGPLVSTITTPTYTGTLTTTVISGDPSNALGGLTFIYSIHNDATSIGNMDRLTVSSFAGFLTDVSFQPGGVAPFSQDRSGPGDVVGFSYLGTPIGGGVIGPGTTTALMVIQTDAHGFTLSTAGVIDGVVTSVASYAPAPGGGVPEPATLSIAAIGGVGLLLRRRRA